jgi:hypothetical protein
VLQDDSSRNVTELGAERKDHYTEEKRAAGQRSDGLPMTSEDALRLSIKLAVDSGDYERAIALLEVAKRTETKLNAVTGLTRAHDWEDR